MNDFHFCRRNRATLFTEHRGAVNFKPLVAVTTAPISSSGSEFG